MVLVTTPSGLGSHCKRAGWLAGWLGLSLSGTPNGPTGYGGAGVWPPTDFIWGGSIKWLRRLCSYDYYNISGTSVTIREWHATFTLSQRYSN